ncbi:cytochrome P450 [Pterulicium gracile]|uniref:Cytochrome P450 n=1 Tax=Pterulicium gracile TaxID=1884261 RepID=A0A5C3QMB0_9AGAR|nr:cytochrome P450 [Pterula gracilis]
MIVELLVLVLGLWLYSRLKFVRQMRAIAKLPGLRQGTDLLSFPGNLWNLYLPWTRRFTLYKENGNDTISLVPYFAGRPAVYTSNMDVARQVIGGSHRCDFLKPEEFSQTLLVWGVNLVAADGDTWRTHRKVMGPAFSNSLYEMVWEKTAEIYKDIVHSEGWANRDVVETPVIQDVTFKLALLVLANCGFGFPFSWSSPPTTANGEMSVLEALSEMLKHQLVLMIPKKLWNLPFKALQSAKKSHDLIYAFMQEKVKERQAEIKQDGGFGTKTDAFSLLVRANSQGEKTQLDENELISNIYVLLFAGHETTAHTLAATLAYMCIYPKIQEEVFQQIQSVAGTGTDPIFADQAKLDKVMAIFYEAGRLFPAGWVMIRQAVKDTILEVPNPIGEEGTTSLPLPEGTNVIVDMIGTQINDRYFEEPEKFKPERWYGLAPSDFEKVTTFSVGPRACLGRKFAETEAVCFLTYLMRDYRVEALLSPGETLHGWRERVLDANIMVTLGVKDVPLKFIRRT